MKRYPKIFADIFIQATFLILLMPCKANISTDTMVTMALPYVVASYKKTAEDVVAGGIGIAGLTFGLWLDKKIAHIIDESTNKDNEFVERVNQELTDTQNLNDEIDKISQAIDEKISQLLEKEYMPNFEFFCTTKSKIFVLQNIQDFFEFKQDEKYKLFNSLIYEICIKKINELEKQEMSKTEEWIDAARDTYIKKYEVSVGQLNDMTLATLSKKINIITIEMDALENDLGETAGTSNINFLALVSILGHLEYKKRYKLKEKNQEYSLDQFFKQEEYGKHLKVMEKALQAKKIAQQKWLAERNKEQQSIFSRIRSAWNSFWYGNQ